MQKRLIAAGAALFLTLASTSAYAQDCNPLSGDCGDDGGDGDGGLGGLSGGGTIPGKGGIGTPTLPVLTATTLINFNAVPGVLGTPVSSYVESGYNFQAISGAVLAGNGAYGTRGLFVLGPGAANYIPGPANILSLTRTDGGLFSVDSFFNILASTEGVNTLSLSGYVNGALTASSTVTTQGVYGFGFPQLSGLAGNFDTVLFNFSTTGSSNQFDNLSVTAAPAAAVPEPAAWAMMIFGFTVAGGAIRLRRRRTSSTYA